MEIRELDPHDEVTSRRHWEIGWAAAKASRPHDFYVPWPTAWSMYAEGRDDADIVLLGAFDGDVMWGAARVDLTTYDNLHSATVSVATHPARQREGIGRSLAGASSDVVRRQGRRVLHTEAYAPLDGPSAGVEFAEAMGYTRAIEEGMKVVDLAATEAGWDALAAEVARSHEGYPIVTWVDRVPDAYLDDYCRLNELFFDEAPMGELEVQAERWDEERARNAERRYLRAGRRTVSAGALAPDGTLVALTELIVNEHARTWGFQSGTLVSPEHRGHRLGIAVKVANHRQVRAHFPECTILVTGNADVNAPMSAVNEALGYREVERCIELQRTL